MGPESSSSPSGKRSRDPEDEVYLDNLHSHKRYLSEIMASSLNGLTVGDSLPENFVESPARSEMMCYQRDEISSQYSPMSEDSEEPRFIETVVNICSAQPDSLPTSPVSPYRYPRPLSGFFSTGPTTSYPSLGCNLTTMACSQPRHWASDSERRFPSSPSDICHSADLRRTTLLRSVQMRAQPLGPPAFELPFSVGQNIESEETQEDTNSCIEECSSMGISECEVSQEKSCRVLNMNVEGEELREEVFGGEGSRREIRASGKC